MILNLSIETWIRFIIWLAPGFFSYFGYSRSHSRLTLVNAPEPAELAGATVDG